MSATETIRVALAGNPNSGKTTIFNNMTGAKQHVGNYPGVTVEKKDGIANYEGKTLAVLDLPGTYSLTARSLDELVARNAIIDEKPEVIVNVLDTSNLERHLYLTAQLLELEVPLVLNLNMTDVAEDMGITIDPSKLAKAFDSLVVSTNGKTNEGVKNLMAVTCQAWNANHVSNVVVPYGVELEAAISELRALLEGNMNITYPTRWLAIKLLENDKSIVERVEALGGKVIVEKAAILRGQLGSTVDLEIVFQEARHKFATAVYNDILVSKAELQETTSDKIDKVLTHRLLGLPIFLFIMWSLFNLVFEVGAYPQGWLEELIGKLGEWITTVVPEGELQSLLVDGVIGGVGAVISFLPLIVILFLGISFLEDTGYMARAAFIMDRLMRAFGLHGKSFIPMLLGFGCTVPAVMGTRILDNPRDRMVTILVSPFMSCSARLPVYTLLIGAFFAEEMAGTVLFGVYTFGVVLAIIFAKLFRSTLFKGESDPFVMELPPYHMPTLKTVLIHMWDRAWLYVKKAGTFILAASIIVWFLVSYPAEVEYSKDFEGAKAQVTAMYDQKAEELIAPLSIAKVEDNEALVGLVESMAVITEEAAEAEDGELAEAVEKSDYNLLFADLKAKEPSLYPVALALYENKVAMEEEVSALDNEEKSEKLSQSYAAVFGKAIEPIIKPLGYDWKVGIGLVAGMAAKEVLVSTLGTVYAVQADADDNTSLREILANDPDFSAASALSLMVFVLIYPPCLAALAVLKRELGSWGWLGFVTAYSIGLAWICAFLVYEGAKALGL